MKRRRRIILRTLAVLALGVAIVVGGGAFWLLKTAGGHRYIRNQVVTRITNAVKGKVHVGQLSGNVLGAPVLDSLEIRDTDDSILVATGEIRFNFRLRDVLRREIRLRNVSVKHPFVHFRRAESGAWNYKTAFKGGGAPRIPGAGPRLGDFLLIDTLTVTDGTFRWTEPWHPDKWLRGSARDSVINYNLTRTDSDIKRAGPHFVRRREWTAMQATLPLMRLRDPATPGVLLQFERLNADEFDPPFKIREARGSIIAARDTIHLDIPSFRLLGSGGSARGTLATKDGFGVAVHVVGDSVSLADIAWLYPTFPKEGSGRMELDIRRPHKGGITEYVLTKMDVSTTQSRLRGKMTFGVGEPILRITNVDVDLLPVDFKLFEQFAGEPLALPWAGQLRGHVWARGGPLTQFYVDSSRIEFADANVPGVVNRFRGSGEVDILRTAYTAFHDFALDIEQFDFRTMQAVNPDFPLYKGWIAGTAQLDSVWLDVRFRDLNMRWVMDTLTSRFTGAGRMTLTDEAVIYDAALTVSPISLDALAPTYPKLPVRGLFSGPVTIRGSIENLAVTTDLTGEAGRIRSDIRMDAYPPGYSGSGKVEFIGVKPDKLLVNPGRYAGEITATVEAALRGDSLANLDGEARVALARSTYAGLRFDGGRVRTTFADGIMRVDTLRLDSDAMTVVGAGGIGLRPDRRDSLSLTIDADSLGGLRGFIAPVKLNTAADSLMGSVHVTARLLGNVDSLDSRFTLRSSELVYGLTTARQLRVDGEIADLLGRRVGKANAVADTVVIGGIRLNALNADATLTGGDTARIIARARSATGPTVDAGADVNWDTTGVRARVDSLQLVVGKNQWRLDRAAMISSVLGTITIDTVRLRAAEGEGITLAATLPNRDEITGMFRADAFPLGDLSALTQMTIPLSGRAALAATVTGTRDSPRIGFRMIAQQAQVGEATIEGVDAEGQYANRALKLTADVKRGGAVVARAEGTLPIDLSLRAVPKRLLDEAISGTFTADSTDLAVMQTFIPAITKASGWLDARLTFGGTFKRPQFQGLLEIANGTLTIPRLGVTYSGARARIRAFGDSIHIDTLRVTNRGTARVFGGIKLGDWSDPRFDLRFATDGEFQIIKAPTIGDLFLDTRNDALRLAGRQSRSDLTGSLWVNGAIYIPETITKKVIELDNEALAGIIDTTVPSNRRLLPSAPPAVVRNMTVNNVRVSAGDNLRLRSSEINVRMTGALDLTVGTSTQSGTFGERSLVYSGTLSAAEGTYRLNLGPLQRTFNVYRGTMQFFEDPDIPPAIDIEARLPVRSYDQREARPDVTIVATLGGTLLQPTVRLSSLDSRISQSDAISYLLTGAPSFGIGGRNTDYTTAITRSLFTSLGSVLGESLTGGVVDELTLSFAGLSQGYGSDPRALTGNLLAGTRINAGLQLTDNTFARLDFGLCTISQYVSGNSKGLDPVAFADAIGGKIDVRLNPGLTFSFGAEPATSALLCAQGARARGFVPTPRQLAFDLMKLWRF